MTISLFPARSAHFDWLIAGTPVHGPDGIWLAEPEFEPPEILRLLRDAALAVDAVLGTSAWLILDQKELLGSCDIKCVPDENGIVEIGYGIAAHHRGKGIGTRAIALLIDEISRLTQVKGIAAETTLDNFASQKVLEHNGFERIGRRHDDEDGELIVWRWRGV